MPARGIRPCIFLNSSYMTVMCRKNIDEEEWGKVMLNQVRYFQAVVRLGSFTEAAEECHISQSAISQSAISQQIKALEQ